MLRTPKQLIFANKKQSKIALSTFPRFFHVESLLILSRVSQAQNERRSRPNFVVSENCLPSGIFCNLATVSILWPFFPWLLFENMLKFQYVWRWTNITRRSLPLMGAKILLSYCQRQAVTYRKSNRMAHLFKMYEQAGYQYLSILGIISFPRRHSYTDISYCTSVLDSLVRRRKPQLAPTWLWGAQHGLLPETMNYELWTMNNVEATRRSDWSRNNEQWTPINQQWTIMQNKANFRNDRMNTTFYSTKDYENKIVSMLPKNKAKQSQFQTRCLCCSA